MKERARRIAFGPWGAVLIVAALIGLFVFTVMNNAEKVQSEQAAVDTQATLDKVADPLAELCVHDETVRARLGPDLCFTAQQAASAPVTQPPAGPSGAAGEDGRGITGTSIDGSGHLLVSYTDGSQIDAGRVVGPAGVDGRGVASASITDGDLIVTYTDGSASNLGRVVGPQGETGTDGADGTDGEPGRGIASTDIVDGRLVVTYTDGTVQDAGEVPAGPAGPPGELPTSYTNHYPDGTSQTCTRDGGAESTPVYRCGERA